MFNRFTTTVILGSQPRWNRGLVCRAKATLFFLILAGLALVAPVAAQSVYFGADTISSTNPPIVPGFGSTFEGISNFSGLGGPNMSIVPDDINFSTLVHNTDFVVRSDKLVDDQTTSGNWVFDFNTPSVVTDILVWNYTQSVASLTNRGVNSYTIEVDTGSGLTQIASGNLDPANYSNHVAQIVDIPDQTGVTQLVLNALSVHGGNAIGIDEVVFRDNTNQIVIPPGDVTLDTLVNSDDFDRLSEFMLQEVLAVDDPGNPMGYTAREQGDLDLNGVIDLADFGIFKDDPARTFPLFVGEFANVPEPTAAGLLAMGLLLLAGGRRVNRR